jgi:hypothetical protein
MGHLYSFMGSDTLPAIVKYNIGLGSNVSKGE